MLGWEMRGGARTDRGFDVERGDCVSSGAWGLFRGCAVHEGVARPDETSRQWHVFYGGQSKHAGYTTAGRRRWGYPQVGGFQHLFPLCYTRLRRPLGSINRARSPPGVLMKICVHVYVYWVRGRFDPSPVPLCETSGSRVAPALPHT